jgi:hypothetical protein
MCSIRWPRVALLLTVGFASGTPLVAQVTGELDRYWAEVSRTVEEGDFAGYKALYHADAVMVSDYSDDSYPIASAFDGWEQGFTDTREGRAEASVRFRFTRRLNDASTAHETGIFNYRFESDGQVSDQYVHFEALLVRKDGWLMMMEFQKAPATPEEWEAAGRPE